MRKTAVLAKTNRVIISTLQTDISIIRLKVFIQVESHNAEHDTSMLLRFTQLINREH